MIAAAIIEACARHSHEINRAYCAAFGDASQVPWDDAPTWQRDSARAGVCAVLSGEATTPEQQHQCWLDQKVADGWVYGPVKDPVAKTHPCMVPYAELPAEQRAKDHLFRAAVLGMAQALTKSDLACVVYINDQTADARQVAELVAERVKAQLESVASLYGPVA